MKQLIYIITLFSFCLCQIKIGELAPDFSLTDENNKIHTLEKYKGKNIVLYFYPKDFTPGCTQQACSLRDISKELIKRNTVVLGISYDSREKHVGFSKKYNLNFPLLSDKDKSISKLYESKGWLFPKRKTFIINKEGKIAHIIDPVNIITHNNIILSILDSLLISSPK